MSDRWTDYIRSGLEDAGGPLPFALRQWEALAPITAAIRRAAASGSRLLDIGCGAGIYSSLLAHHGFSVTGIDEEPRIIALAREMSEYLHAGVRFEEGSAFDLSRRYGQFDLVYSLGVVEHFDSDVTIQLLREQARCAPVVVVAIPTKYTRLSGPITDERLYTLGQFERLVAAAGMRVRESFVYGDVPTRTAVNLGRVLPKVLYRPIRHLVSYGMGLCCVGERG